ncbi:MAG TPA: hypothetical protein VGK90_00325 [Rhizomicrobium sp.]|jgi:hypothetical protein
MRYLVFVLALLVSGCIVLPSQEREKVLARLKAECEAKGMVLLSHDEIQQHGIANITPYETSVGGTCVSKGDPRISAQPQA